MCSKTGSSKCVPGLFNRQWNLMRHRCSVGQATKNGQMMMTRIIPTTATTNNNNLESCLQNLAWLLRHRCHKAVCPSAGKDSGCHNWCVLFVGVLVIAAIQFGVYIRTRMFGHTHVLQSRSHSPPVWLPTSESS